MFAQDAIVAVLRPQPVRNEHARVRPARRTVHVVHVKIHAPLRGDLAVTAVSVLTVPHIRYVLARKRSVTEQIGRRVDKDLRVSRPAVSFARGAIGGNVRVVVLCRPQRVFDKLRDERVRTGKGKRLLHARIHGDCREILRFPIRIPFHEDIAESENGKLGLIFVDALPAVSSPLRRCRNTLDRPLRQRASRACSPPLSGTPWQRL